MFIIVKWSHLWQAAFENESPIFFKSQLLTPVSTNIVVAALHNKFNLGFFTCKTDLEMRVWKEIRVLSNPTIL